MYLKGIPYYALFGYFQSHYVSDTMLTDFDRQSTSGKLCQKLNSENVVKMAFY